MSFVRRLVLALSLVTMFVGGLIGLAFVHWAGLGMQARVGGDVLAEMAPMAWFAIVVFGGGAGGFAWARG